MKNLNFDGSLVAAQRDPVGQKVDSIITLVLPGSVVSKLELQEPPYRPTVGSIEAKGFNLFI